MTTALLDIPVEAWTTPDASSSSNYPPGAALVKSSATAPAPYFVQRLFDDARTEWITSPVFSMPSNYASGATLLIDYKMASATANDVKVDGRIAAITPGDSTDMDAKAFGSANTTTQTVAGTAGYVKEISLTLTNADSVAAGDLVMLYFARVGGDGSDTASGDMEVVKLTLQYTTT